MTTSDFARKSLHISEAPSQIPGSTIWAVETEITVKMAGDWLDKYNAKNRNCRQGTLLRIASDISAGRWLVSHQGIAFDENQSLTSGQHRLQAVLKAAAPIRSLVFLNCPTAERNVIDQGAVRNVRDVAELGHGDKLSTDIVAAARSMAYGVSVRHAVQMTAQETYEFIQAQRPALEFVLKNISRRVSGVTSATVIGALCRGYYYMKRGDLKRFIEVLVEGFSVEPADKPIILLRNWLSENRDNLGNMKGRVKAFARTQAAMLAFINGEQPARLSDCTDDAFPLKKAS